MKNFFLFFILFALTAEISVANSCEPSSYLKFASCLDSTKTDSVALDNLYMRVLRDGAACTAANTTNFGTRVIVALGKIKFKSSLGTIKLKRGQIAVFLEEESYELPEGSYFEIAFKKKSSAADKTRTMGRAFEKYHFI